MRAVQRLGFRAEWSWKERLKGAWPIPHTGCPHQSRPGSGSLIVSPSPYSQPTHRFFRAREDGKAGKGVAEA